MVRYMETLPNELKCLIMSYAHPIHPIRDELNSIFNFYGRDLKYGARAFGFLSLTEHQSEQAEYWCYGDDGWVL